MKLILERWRQYVNEELLNEVPLADFGYYDKESENDFDPKQSVGYAQSKAPGYKQKVIKFFDQTKDLWYVIFTKQVRPTDKKFGRIKRDEQQYHILKKMQRENGWDPNAKYIVVSFSQFNQSDWSAPNWQIVHDVIGHTIEKYIEVFQTFEFFLDTKYKRFLMKKGLPDNEIGPKIEKMGNLEYRSEKIFRPLYETLPDDFQIANPGDLDLLPDILGAIFLDKLPPLEEVDLGDSEEDREEIQFFLDFFKKQVKKIREEEIQKGDFFRFGGWTF